MRTLILSPIDRRKILFGKNIALTVLALVFATVTADSEHRLLFRDLTTPGNAVFLALSLLIFAAISSTDRQLAFDSFSQAHAVWKANERVGRGRACS